MDGTFNDTTTYNDITYNNLINIHSLMGTFDGVTQNMLVIALHNNDSLLLSNIQITLTQMHLTV